MQNNKIFVLQLENDKWFLHLSNQTNPDYVLFESQVLYDYVKKNAPIKIYEAIESHNNYDINTLTRKYMSWIGVENVRGGIYSDEILPDYLIKGLELELNTDCGQQTYFFKSISDKQGLEFNDFVEHAKLYSELLSLGYQKITRDFFVDLEWLEDKVKSSVGYKETHKNGLSVFNYDDDNRYKRILNVMNIVRDKYFQLDEDNIRVNNSALMKYPEFTFDYFVYHQHLKRNWESETKNALEIIKNYQSMGYTLINIIDGKEFDLLHPK